MRLAQFLFGDFEEYLRAGAERFDAVVASGVLYHVRNPVELIHNLARVTDRVFIWTHYFVRERLAGIPHMAHRVGESHSVEHAGFRHTLHRYNYGDFLDTTRFAGGSQGFSHWLNATIFSAPYGTRGLPRYSSERTISSSQRTRHLAGRASPRGVNPRASTFG